MEFADQMNIAQSVYSIEIYGNINTSILDIIILNLVILNLWKYKYW